MRQVSQDHLMYDRDTNTVSVYSLPVSDHAIWAVIEYGIARQERITLSHPQHCGDYISHRTNLSPHHPTNPFLGSHNHPVYGDIRSARVRLANGQRGRFRIRKEQHEKFMNRSENLPPKHHDRYLFGVYEQRYPGEWRIVQTVTVTAPELDRLRSPWTWTDTEQYEVAQITWSQIPGLDPLQIESEHDGYWNLDDF